MKLIIKNTIGLLLALILVIGFSGCATKAKPGQTTAFVDGGAMQNNPLLPFHKVWVDPEFDKFQYKKLYVEDVNTQYMVGLTDWEKGMREDEIKADVRQVALYTRDAIKKAFREDPEQQLKIVDVLSKDPGTLILEIAITEVVPSKVALNVLGYAPFGIGMGIKLIRKMADDVSTVSIEARIRDAATGKIVAMLSDRNAQQTTVVSAKDLSWYSHVHGIIDNWALKLVKVANRKPGETVKDTSSFTLKPW
jgi:hypothetical protein